MKYIELFHPEYYSHFMKRKNSKIIRLVKTKPKNVFAHGINKTEYEIVQILKKIFPELKITENSFIFDGLLECDIKVSNPKSKKEALIEFFGPTHFRSNSSSYLLETGQLILDLKRKISSVVVIPYFEWNELGTSAEKENYVRNKVYSLLF